MFSSRERANFELEDNAVEDIGDTLDRITMAEQSNRMYDTFDYAYTNYESCLGTTKHLRAGALSSSRIISFKGRGHKGL